MRVAVVHDWLYVVGGAERVLREILRCYPGADVFCLFDVLKPADRAWIGFDQARTSFLQRLPGIAKRHRSYLPLMPLAIEQLDLSAYDLVISSSYAVAKGVLTGPDQVHVAYVHSPMRYAWDLQHEYLRESGYAAGLKGMLARMVLHRMRLWDARTAHGPNAVIANSSFIARRIRKAYGRDATVIHPPVSIPPEPPAWTRGRHFLVAARLVPYKNVRAVVEAFNLMPDEHLIVAGDGPEAGRLRGLAQGNVTFAGYVSDAELRRLMGTARAFVFAAEEDFGIVPIEAQAEGTPVLALGRGGVRETVVGTGAGRTGLFFATPEPAAIAACVQEFIAQEGSFQAAACYAQARRFSADRFRAELTAFVGIEVARLHGNIDAARARTAEAAPLISAVSDRLVAAGGAGADGGDLARQDMLDAAAD